LLYFLYTDCIVFAPLASLYYSARDAAAASGRNFPYETRRDYVRATMDRGPALGFGLGKAKRPGPCSSKAVYRLADSESFRFFGVLTTWRFFDPICVCLCVLPELNLTDLKARAFAHVMGSLTTDIIAYEVFSSFSAAYPEVQKYQTAFLLDKWVSDRCSFYRGPSL
jgi:hypothetical protein